MPFYYNNKTEKYKYANDNKCTSIVLNAKDYPVIIQKHKEGLDNMKFNKLQNSLTNETLCVSWDNILSSSLITDAGSSPTVGSSPTYNAISGTFSDGKTKTRMYETPTGVHILKQDGTVKTIIPEIVKVKPINNRVVIVEFADGTQEKAVLAKEDTFSLEQGISICITKKLLSNIIGNGNGSSVYNKLIDYALKKYNDDIAYEKATAEIEQREKQYAEKKERKKKDKEKKQQAKYRQEYIDAICEAVIKAMSENKKE